MEAALPLRSALIGRTRFTYLRKLLAAAALVALADLFFYRPDQVGASLGLFALLLILCLVALRPDIRARRDALLAAAAGALFALMMIDEPGLLALGLCWLALGLAVLLPRAARFGSGWDWLLRLGAHTISLPLGPIRDGRRLAASRRRREGVRRSAGLPILALPILGSLLFLLLFAAANPLIAEAFGSLHPLGFLDHLSFERMALWAFTLMLAWRVLRPRLLFTRRGREAHAVPLALPGVTTGSVTLSLVAFNAIFAVQNGLDILFLWSGAPLPEGMSLAEYAHRGAYPLIATALLAGLFVLVTLRPGSAMAASPLVRRLVSLWIAQNVLLVASTMLRLIAYIEAYSLTELRIEALIWMGLVAVGLLLICARLWFGKIDTWLINANLAASALVLSVSAAIDHDRIAAAWNVAHARETGGRGASLDLCYLHQMGASALLPLIKLEAGRLPRHLRHRVTWLRNDIMDRLEARQAVWQSWTWRGARRLGAAREALAGHRLPRFKAAPRRCDERLQPLAPETAPALPPPVSTMPPLTAGPGR